MEPNNQNQNSPQKPTPPQDRPTYADFHAEGIDIVTNSGVSEANEFSTGEANAAAESALTEIDRQEAAAEQVPQKPLTPEQATRIANLQEIPRPQMAIPQKPLAPSPARASVMPPAQPAPKAPTPAEQVPERPKTPEVKNDPSIKQLRTFKTDAEEAVRYQNVSAIDIALAEQKKREAAATPIEYVHDDASHARLGIFIIIVMAIIVALLGGWYYWFTSSQTAEAPAPISKDKISALIPYKVGSSIVLDPEKNAIDLIGLRLAAVEASTSSVFALLPKANQDTTEGVPLSTIFLDTDMPESLLRSFSGEYMMGSYSSGDSGPFMILKTSSFPLAFAGMLEWESIMAYDLSSLINAAGNTELGTTTRVFDDTVFQNVDARVTRDQNNRFILGYAFPNKDTLVIATTENGLRHAISEILKVRTIQ